MKKININIFLLKYSHFMVMFKSNINLKYLLRNHYFYVIIIIKVISILLIIIYSIILDFEFKLRLFSFIMNLFYYLCLLF
jgi:hypothetical protein